MPKYSDGLILAWQLAAYEAGAASSASIEPGHFFVSLCKMCDLPLEDVLDGSSKGAVERKIAAIEAEVNELKSVFGKIGLDPKRFRRSLRAQLQGEDGERPSDGVMHRSSQSRRLFSRAERMCSDDACRVVGMLHLLRAIGEVEGAPWETIIEKMGVNRADLVGIPVGTGGSSAAHAEGDGLANDPSPRKRRTPFLDEFGRDLTKLAAEGKMPPMIGRREELRRLGRILLQQRRNNAILVGDAGVGKTCIVEGLAQRIVAGECPEQFRSKRIIEISMSPLVAGSKYRGDFEERIQGVLAEAGSDPSIVLFIDEMHTLVGAGSAGSGGMDAANILKPALARGDISCIGASTTREYRQYIEKDSALARRFQVVWVDEPTRGEALEIMQGLRPTLEQHHGLTISDEALEAAVEFSMRYATDLRLPDKAIDLVDEACARARFQ
jgi:ATP-dependent Clp protease ATP-binding subunit ClpC